MKDVIEKLELIEKVVARSEILCKEFLDVKEASDYLNLSKSTLYKMTGGKKLPHYVPNGKKIYFRRSELDDWVLSHKVNSVDELEEGIENYLNRNNKG